MQIGYHASQEQLAPDALLAWVVQAEAAGFDAAKSSEHFHPWSLNQGQSGFAWTWIGAALQATRLPIGLIATPGYRHHPTSVAQAAATIVTMFPGRFWLALGNGEAINEAVTGTYWPDKAERNARLRECVAVIRALLRGEEVTHRGRITVVEASLFTLPPHPVPLFGAAMTPQTAAAVGGDPKQVAATVAAFRAAGGAGKPVHIQHALSGPRPKTSPWPRRCTSGPPWRPGRGELGPAPSRRFRPDRPPCR